MVLRNRARDRFRKDCGGKGIRTPGLFIANEALYQLSYTPDFAGVMLTAPQRLSRRPATFQTIRRTPASERIQKIGDIASDLPRGAGEEFAVAAAKHSEGRPSFLFESDQDPPGRRVHKFAGQFNFHRAGSEAAPVPRRL